MRTLAIVAIIVVGLPLGIALGRYGSVQPCDMLAIESVRLRAKSYGSVNAPGLATIGARIAYAHRSPGECLVALGRVFTQDPVDVMLACMQTELGGEISKAPPHKFAEANNKCSSLGWFLWRESSP